MKKIVCFLLVIVAFLPIVVSCSGKNVQEGQGGFCLQDYSVIYAQTDPKSEQAARSLAEQCGGLPVFSDSESEGEKEILVGPVQGRSYSYYNGRLAKTGGWCACVLGDDVYLDSDLGEYGEMISACIPWLNSERLQEGDFISSSAAYPVETVRFADIPLGFYDILYDEREEKNKSAAELLSEEISLLVGYSLPVYPVSESENFYNIFIGQNLSDTELSEEECLVVVGEDTVKLFGAEENVKKTVESFCAHFFRSGEKVVDIKAGEQHSFYCWEYLDSDFTFDESLLLEECGNGVTYENISMTNAGGEPLSMFLLRAEAGGGWDLRVGTDEDYSIGNPTVSSVLDTALQYRAKGEDVLFACNGGYFQMSNNNLPEGVLISDGKLLSVTNGGLGAVHHDFFGVTELGKFIIGDNATLKKCADELVQACGGRGILLKDGELYDIKYDAVDAIGIDRHPRTAIGLCEDGDLIIAVVDGRQQGYSVGMNLCDLALLLKGYGVTDALNLDGGGSSTFVVKDDDKGLRVINKTSNAGHSLRAVGDCIIITASQ